MTIGSIDNNLTIEFSDRLHVAAQQNKSRLREHVIVKQMSGDVWAYDGIGQVEARLVPGRVSPVVFAEIDHNRRKIARQRFEVTLPIDGSDARGVLLDPEAEYAARCMAAMNRQWDKVGVDAAFANVLTGRDFATSITFANDNGLVVNANAGLTYDFLLEIQKNWTDNEVGLEEDEAKLFLMTGTEQEALMKEVELTSGDFSRQMPVDKGEIVSGVGIQFIKYGANALNPILNVTGGIRDNVAMTGRALCYGLSKEMDIKIQERVDLIDTMQVQILGEFGAVRTEGKLMQKVTTTA